jgi:hypothetical protein
MPSGQALRELSLRECGPLGFDDLAMWEKRKRAYKCALLALPSMAFGLALGSMNNHEDSLVALVLLHWHQLGDGGCSNSPTES